MKTTLIVYMPGHAGNFILRLFALSESVMPVLKKQDLNKLINQKKELPEHINRLENYKFSKDTKKYVNWQEYHRAWADYYDWPQYRYLNVLHQLKYNLMFAIHPLELAEEFLPNESTVNTNFYETCFYFVELDAEYDAWVNKQKKKLNFVWRDGEYELFELFKKQFAMKPISLTKLLGTVEEFSAEYYHVCSLMKIEPHLDAALELRTDWRSIRFNDPDL